MDGAPERAYSQALLKHQKSWQNTTGMINHRDICIITNLHNECMNVPNADHLWGSRGRCPRFHLGIWAADFSEYNRDPFQHIHVVVSQF